MGIHSESMKRRIGGQRPGSFAAVCPPGALGLYTIAIASISANSHLTLIDDNSRGSYANRRHYPLGEIKLIDQIVCPAGLPE
jgi:hypothetical protein